MQVFNIQTERFIWIIDLLYTEMVYGTSLTEIINEDPVLIIFISVKAHISRTFTGLLQGISEQDTGEPLEHGAGAGRGGGGGGQISPASVA